VDSGHIVNTHKTVYSPTFVNPADRVEHATSFVLRTTQFKPKNATTVVGVWRTALRHSRI